MRRIFLILLLLSSYSKALANGYEWSFVDTKLPITNSMVNLNAVDIVGDSIWICSGFASYISGIKGEIYFSADRGETFSIQTTQFGTHAIKMLDSKLGYCGGYEGRVYKTTDGGQNWASIGSTGVTNVAIEFPPESDTGYVAGFKGVVKKITPTGLVSIPQEVTNDMRAISCPSKNHIHFVWWSDIMFYDGVNPMEHQEISVGSNRPLSLLSLFMLNDSVGWIAGAYGLIAKTVTGCWNLNEEHAFVGQETNLNTDLYSIKFINENIGVACGYGGNIVVTSDGGDNWDFTGQGLTNGMLLATHFFDNGDILVVGNSKVGETPTILLGRKITSVSETSTKFAISPNPASEYLEISLDRWSPPSRWTPSEIRIYNAFGKCVTTTPFLRDTPSEKGNRRIDISHLPVGLYFIQIGNNTELFMVVK